MRSPLIDRLTAELNWPEISSTEDLSAFLASPGDHCVFVTGDPQKNLETNDAAVILPELVMTFQGRFDCAVVTETFEEQARTDLDAWVTPALVFFRGSEPIGKVSKVRDWADYLSDIRDILDQTTPRPAAAE